MLRFVLSLVFFGYLPLGQADKRCAQITSGLARNVSMQVWVGPTVDDFPIEDYFPNETVWLLERGRVRYSRDSWAFRLWRMRTSYLTPDDRFAQHYLTPDLKKAWIRDKAFGETIDALEAGADSAKAKESLGSASDALSRLRKVGIVPLDIESPQRHLKVALISFKDPESNMPVSMILTAPPALDHGPLLASIMHAFKNSDIKPDFATTGWGYLHVVPYLGQLIVGEIDFQPVMSRAIAPYEDLYWDLRNTNPDRPVKRRSVKVYLESLTASLAHVGEVHPERTQVRFSSGAGWRSLKEVIAIQKKSSQSRDGDFLR